MNNSPPLFHASVAESVELRRLAVRRAKEVCDALPPDQIEQILHVA